MKILNLQEVADYLEVATIDSTSREGAAYVHWGQSESGARFVLMVNHFGVAALTEI